MAVGGEKILFLGTVVVVGGLTYSLVSSPYETVRPASGKREDLAELASGAIPRAPGQPLEFTAWSDALRGTFSEPREWTPLPPATLPRPPVPEPALVPPAPLIAVASEFRGVTRITVQPERFEFDASAGSSLPAAEEDAAPAGFDGEAVGSPEEEYRRRFDWVEVRGRSEPYYGWIRNEDRWGLADRPEEDLRLQRVDPETQQVTWESVTLPRASLKEGGIHFADTAVNRVELELRKIPRSEWNPGMISRLLERIDAVMAEGTNDAHAWRRAAEELEGLREMDPLEPGVYERLADCRAALLDHDGELQALDAAEAAGVRSGGLVLRRARWYWRYGARRHALALLESGRKDHPANRELRLFLGQCFLEQGEFPRALAEFEAAEGGTPEERRRVIRLQGEAQMLLGKPPLAVKEAERVLAIEGDDPRALHLLASAQYAAGDAGAAAATFLRLRGATQDPGLQAASYLGEGLALVRSGEYQSARGRLERARELDPLLGGAALAGLAFLYEVTGDSARALREARDAVEHQPGDAYLHYLLGRELRLNGEFEAALSSLREALRLGASFPDLFNELGAVAMHSDAADAIRYLEESLAREPRDETRLLLAHAHLVAEDLVGARRLFESVRTSSAAALGMAYCDYRRGDSESAKEELQLVLTEMGSAPAEHRSYAESSLRQILDVESKHQWVDGIRWQQIGNGWQLEERFGIGKRVQPGRFVLSGTQRPGTSEEDWTYLHRPIEDLARFQELEFELTVPPENKGRVGVGLVQWHRSTSGAPVPRVALMVAVDPDGTLRVLHRENLDDPEGTWKSAGEAEVEPGAAFPVVVTRAAGEGASFELSVNGTRVGDPVEVKPWRGGKRQQVSAVFFVAAEPGKKVEAELNRARIVEFVES